MSDTGAVLEGPGGQRANRWVETVIVVGQELRLTIDFAGTPSSTSAAPWLLVLGIGLSLLAGVLIYDRSRRRSMTTQMATLQQTLAEKDRFLASVSHELRTPLTAVVGMAEILASRINNFGKEDGELIQDVRTSAQELETLVEDHLTSARLTAGALTVNQDQIDLAAIVARAVAVTERPHRLSIRISDLGACTGDAIRVRQIVRNLLNNSYRYGATRIEIRANNTSEQTVIEFLNDGPPVSADVVGTMFEPFVKGQRPGQPESIGLGLSVSRKLAQRMGGDLVYTYEDGFVKFSLSLPAAAPRPAALRLVEPFAS
jgi:signal transduction histidine kinase